MKRRVGGTPSWGGSNRRNPYWLAGAQELDMPNSEMFKRKMVQRLSGPEPVSATALSKQVDVPQATLSKWLRQAGGAQLPGLR